MDDVLDLDEYNSDEYKIIKASNAEQLARTLWSLRPEEIENKKIVCVCDGIDFREVETKLGELEKLDALATGKSEKENQLTLKKLPFEKFECHECDFRGTSRLNPIKEDIENVKIDDKCKTDELEVIKTAIETKHSPLLDKYNAEVRISFQKDSNNSITPQGADVAIVDKDSGIPLFDSKGTSLDKMNNEEAMESAIQQSLYKPIRHIDMIERKLFPDNFKKNSWEPEITKNLNPETDMFEMKKLRMAYDVESQRLDSGEIPKHFSFQNKDEALLFLEATKKEAEKAAKLDLGGKKDQWENQAQMIDAELGKLKNNFYSAKDAEVVINSDNFPVKGFIQDYQNTKANLRMQDLGMQQDKMKKDLVNSHKELEAHDSKYFGLNRFVNRAEHKRLEEQCIQNEIGVQEIESIKRNLKEYKKSSVMFTDFHASVKDSMQSIKLGQIAKVDGAYQNKSNALSLDSRSASYNRAVNRTLSNVNTKSVRKTAKGLARDDVAGSRSM